MKVEFWASSQYIVYVTCRVHIEEIIALAADCRICRDVIHSRVVDDQGL
jgi:hypothetical protein